MLHDWHVEGGELAETKSNDAAPGGKMKLALKVAAIKTEAEGIKSFEVRAADGRDLPGFTAGSHIEVHLPGDMIRSYSLCNDPAERHRYVFAVLREADGRGGSKYLHDEVRVGETLTITAPRNHFALAGREARHHLLLAGGIGVTPMIAMIAELEARKVPWSMHYCTRSAERTAFLKQLKPYIDAGKVVLHHDNGAPTSGAASEKQPSLLGRLFGAKRETPATRIDVPAGGLDIKQFLSSFEVGTHLYYCGPPGFMKACGDSLEPWPPFNVHREFFQGSGQALSTEGNAPFQVKLKSTGKVLDVPADKTIVEVLKANGCRVETDCNEGFCGTCITRFISGEPEHRDTVLSEKDRKSYVMVCCSRAKGLLALDL